MASGGIIQIKDSFNNQNYPNNMNYIINKILLGPVALLPAICVIAVSLLTTTAISKSKYLTLQPVKYENLDGLKGYLAVIVFISHSATWYFYLRTGNWWAPPSNLYIQMTNLSVSMFFMMSGLLFFNKMIKGEINWLNLYISRILRLVPIYALAIIFLFVIIGFLSKFSFSDKESFLTLISQFSKWILFTIKDAPNINNFQNTGVIICYVPWTLRYEWFFYLTLPVLSFLLFRNKPSISAILITICILFFIIPYKDYLYMYFTYFVGGIIAALLVNFGKFSQRTTHWVFSGIIFILALIVAVIKPYQLLPLIIFSVIFCIITGGNTLFGFLSNKGARLLGQLSYGIYMFHGLLLFCLFRFGLGFEKAAKLTSLEHWSLVVMITPIIVLVAFILHVNIELPVIQLTPIVYKTIRDLLNTIEQKITIVWHKILNSKFLSEKWNQNY
ncbi:acyltransferase [Spirosoma sp. BT702]|uniref:Acyltransferase n=1 Tax=Spirosoma profusum TaxID=2771354 RepID=A0A927AS51_9BACT|nr:acyltransferase [Spirosoma profusum]MBD2700710.1 acyltransferase [Spirosoma profusum]